MTSPSDAALNGMRVFFRMNITHPPEQRFDAHGGEVLQLRGQVLDRTAEEYPEIVVRFSGPRRAELWKWAKHGSHLSVDGFLLEVKAWQTSTGQRMAMLVDAQNIFPLSDLQQDLDLGKIGVYSERRSRAGAARAPRNKADQADRMRTLLDRADS